MTQNNPMALISVTDKSGIVDFAKNLVANGYRILSTGGSAKVLRDGGVAVRDVAEYTKSPEIMNGRVKTLHPLVHGGILMDRDNPSHVNDAKAQGIEAIDLVVVNLYDFKENAAKEKLSLEKAIEYIDIGGPTMLRAAAKNYVHTAPVIDPSDYDAIIADIKEHGDISKALRVKLAGKTFAMISSYDAMIASYFQNEDASEDETKEFADSLSLSLVQGLRYGENPHQKAGFYTQKGQPSGLQDAKVLQGKELSYNNILDVDAATAIVRDFPQKSAVAIIKHTNPCGVAVSSTKPVVELFATALKCDPKSAFGGIVAVNRAIDAEAAEAMTSLFLECIAAPHFTDEAKAIFAKKKNLRLLEVSFLKDNFQDETMTVRSVQGGYLVQSKDNALCDSESWQVPTNKKPSDPMVEDLIFAEIVCKHVKSNAIVFAKGEATVAVGAGQMSRIDSATFAANKAKEMDLSVEDSVMASDAFFPFRDTVDLAASFKVAGIIQPGGSIRDDESIKAADENGIAMVFTGTRHFKH